MTIFNLTLLVGGAAALFAIAPISSIQGQRTTAVHDHGGWTLSQRQQRLDHRIDPSRENGAHNHAEYDRVHHELGNIHRQEEALRDGQHDQPTGNQTTNL